MRMLIERHYIEDAVQRAGLDPESLRTDYSGRGMYGKTCIGITGDVTDLLNFVVAMTRILEIEEQADPGMSDYDPRITLLVENVCEDGMGYESIYYWPGLGVTDG